MVGCVLLEITIDELDIFMYILQVVICSKYDFWLIDLVLYKLTEALIRWVSKLFKKNNNLYTLKFKTCLYIAMVL